MAGRDASLRARAVCGVLVYVLLPDWYDEWQRPLTCDKSRAVLR